MKYKDLENEMVDVSSKFFCNFFEGVMLIITLPILFPFWITAYISLIKNDNS